LDRVAIDALQFHGDEPPEFCRQFDRPWLKALRVRSAEQLAADLDRYQGADSLLLDAYKAGVPGGTGETFQWGLIPESWRRRIVLAGGLTPDNVRDAIVQVRPLGVDVSGGIEAGKGVKSAEKMARFVAQVGLADAERVAG
jgi:phosphoribosylanthranilate isomerase